jgi:hypothetical protein
LKSRSAMSVGRARRLVVLFREHGSAGLEERERNKERTHGSKTAPANGPSILLPLTWSESTGTSQKPSCRRELGSETHWIGSEKMEGESSSVWMLLARSGSVSAREVWERTNWRAERDVDGCLRASLARRREVKNGVVFLMGSALGLEGCWSICLRGAGQSADASPLRRVKGLY